jgi:predicted phosphate transport protein (TIGR00153 family)
VRFRLTPRENGFYALFAASADNVVVGASLLSEMIVADRAARIDIADRMRTVEHAGDEATHQILRMVNSSFVTPFDREDIYRLASTLDDVLDAMEAAVDLVVLYELDELPKELSDQVKVITQAAELTASAMPRLKSMKDLTDYWIEVNRLEKEGDRVYRRLLVRLFSGEFDALTVLKLKEVVDALEQAVDGFEHVANTVESIAVKES